MTAAALVETLRARGVTLEPHGDRLRVRPAAAVTPDEVEALRQLKPEVLRLLTTSPGEPAPTAAAPLPDDLVARLRRMPLDQFAREGQPLEVRVNWLPETLWWTPDERHAAILVADGISRGRIWTAGELIDLLAIPGLTGDQIITIAQTKAFFGGTLDSVRERPDPAGPATETDGAPLWPDALPGLGSRHIGSFDPCADCETWSWARYGSTALCLRCARQRETGRDDTR